jgi:hypothetical protein
LVEEVLLLKVLLLKLPQLLLKENQFTAEVVVF